MEQPSTTTPDQRSDGQQAPPEGGLLQRQAMRVQAQVQPVVQVAEAIVDKVHLQTVLTLVSGLWVWGLIFFPFSSFDRVWVIVLGVSVLGLLLAPAGVLWLFWAGLGELIRIPDKLVEMAGEGEGHTDVLLETMAGQVEPRKVRRLWRFFRTVLDLRTLILDSKGLLLQFAVVARVANPVFIGVLFVAFLLSLLLIVVAAVSFFVVIVI